MIVSIDCHCRFLALCDGGGGMARVMEGELRRWREGDGDRGRVTVVEGV